MYSVRSWLVSGTFAAAMGAGVLCGAGLAAADTEGSAGPSVSAAHSANQSPRPGRAAHRDSVARAQPAAAAAVGAPRVRTTPAPGAASVRKSAPAAVTATATPAAAAKSVPVVPSSVPVDPALFAGTYYEQGSVKQFFSIGLVNTSATYSVNPDGSIRVQNSGNYFFNRGPRSSIVGSAVAVNATNTALNVGFSPLRPPPATPPGNYTILENAPDYSWVLVSDPSGRSGYILTRDKTIPAEEYQQLTDRARALGVNGRITPTRQFPA